MASFGNGAGSSSTGSGSGGGGALLTTGGTHTHHTHGTAACNQSNHHHDHQGAIVTTTATTQHSYGGGGKCCGPPPPIVRPVLTLKKPAADLVAESTDEQILENVQQVIRMGSFELMTELIAAWKDHRGATQTAAIDAKLHAYDSSGHTLTHWAAKRVDDVRLVKYFLSEVHYTPGANNSETGEDGSSTSNGVASGYYPTPVHRPTRDDTAMSPLHWACTQDSALTVVKALLDHAMAANANNSTNAKRIPPALELRDGTGCTPVLIASQHGQVATVAYLVQRGADIHAVDTARDSATHWAAYKGSIAVLGLLSFYDTRALQQADAYGQTPLHLASLRGHVSVVRYILQKLLQQPGGPQSRAAAARTVKEILYLKDQNGRTPYELAVHKNRAAVAAVLEAQATALQPNYHSWQAQLQRSFTVDAIRKLCRLRTCKVWLGLPEVDDLDESPKFPFYYVVATILSHVVFYFMFFLPLYNLSSGVLWDFLGLHVVNIFLIGATCYFLWQCHTTNPGRLDSSYAGVEVWRQLYEQTLDAFASDDESIAAKAAAVQLCHTCHIARPARSKHDRFSRSCILQFDHHCPFVGTTVGLFNYKWFFLFLISVTVYLSNFLFLLVVYHSRVGPHSWATLLIGLFLGLHVFFPGFMLVYHAQLIVVNLTTNEHINTGKYDYFWESNSTTSNDGVGNRRFYNPWNKGWWGNILDRFQPGDQCYLLPEQERASEYEMLLIGNKKCCNSSTKTSANHNSGHGMV